LHTEHCLLFCLRFWNLMKEDDAISSGCFPTTQWTQIIAVIQQGDEDSAWNALAGFCQRYRPAIVRFFQRRGLPPELAEEYTQGFFTQRILLPQQERKGFLFAAEKQDGRKFRSFLSWTLWNFLNDQRRLMLSEKAGGKAPHIPLDDFWPIEEASDHKVDARFGRDFDRAFALELIQKATERSKHSEYFEKHLRGEISQQAAAEILGVTENAFKQAFHRFRKRLAQGLWDEVVQLVGPNEDDIREEIRYLMSLFAEASA